MSTAPAPVPMKRTGMNLENFRERKKKKKKKKKNCIERDSNPSILAYRVLTHYTNPASPPDTPLYYSFIQITINCYTMELS